MLGQSETTYLVYGVKRAQVEGKFYCSVFVGGQPFGDASSDINGAAVMKISCDWEVFDSFPVIDPLHPRVFKLLTATKLAAGGKSQTHILDFLADLGPVDSKSGSTDKQSNQSGPQPKPDNK